VALICLFFFVYLLTFIYVLLICYLFGYRFIALLCASRVSRDYDDDELVTLRDCQEKESDQLQEQHSLLEQEAASSRDRDDELTAKNRKLDKKIDSYKRELKQAKDDVSTLKSQLQQTRQDKVVIIGGARDSESGLVHRCCPSVCLSVCLSPKCKKTRFSQLISNLELWSLLTTYRKSYMGFSKNPLLDP